MEKQSRRFFIALPVDDKIVIDSLAGITGLLNTHGSSLKTVHSDNYHLTLKFFGSLEPEIYELIINAFEFQVQLKRIEYRIKGLGFFPVHGEPSVIWAGIECDKQPWSEIIKSVENFASSFGFVPEKRGFMPHLTLARVKNGRAVHVDIKNLISVERHTLFSSSVFSELVLFESILRPEGAEYKKVKVINLF
ncbi:MAG: RNA 2',3'-cyclic phosphodiesterase [Spirochaetae bacterium HGW-Spirochaetae-5]|nr:MAG: RNA 2',3'-cyclic phosphodiesterase [Spirochaetae bacterium HGW-Spirochaetae-5]